MLLGCIGDDFTGSSDLANTLVKNGMATTQYCGVPNAPAASGVEAGVVALKIRSVPAIEAVEQALAALEWLKAQGCQQLFYKYCSTFDSTPTGNIGPVVDALIKALGAKKVVVCPAFPATGRTLFQGHLFVGDKLLNQSGMELHPLNPMTDADIRRVLTQQSRTSVGHVPYPRVREGWQAIKVALGEVDAAGHGLIVVDAIADTDLHAIGRAAADLSLITGGSGIALGLPENFRRSGKIGHRNAVWTRVTGPAAILSGSCSEATRRQVNYYRQSHPALEVSAEQLMSGMRPMDALSWAVEHMGDSPLIFSSADPVAIKAAQAQFGAVALASRIETFFADLARSLVEADVTRLVVAGGETSGAVVTGLGCDALDVGPEIDPGIPLLRVAGRNVALALKSGNFGSDNFFDKALDMMAGATHDS